jgi:hydrogenase maturation protein HypF
MCAAERYAAAADAVIEVPGDGYDTNKLLLDIATRYMNGEDRDKLAYHFHRRLADIIIQNCILYRDKTGIGTAALSGGVYQNKLLLRLTEEGLLKAGFRVLRHSLIPPNDGGICVGQALAGLFKK